MTETLVVGISLFVLASFVGFEIISKVPPTLHTPLMSGANAISGITIVGAILVTAVEGGGLVTTLGFLAIVLAMINVMGGFLVTDRMLQMFKKEKKEAKEKTGKTETTGKTGKTETTDGREERGR
jgi:NAD(P) transhydrogenase subunit alpha